MGGPKGSRTIAAVIPLYNGAKFIEGALRSVFAQTRQPDEIMIIDDGSTDDGVAVVERLSASHPVTLIRRDNGGQSSARNLAVACSKSDLIAPLDQDDEWYPHHLSELVKPFEEDRQGPPLGWVYGNYDLIDHDGLLVSTSFLNEAGVSVEHPKRSLWKMLAADMMVLPCSALISRAAFEEAGGFDERLCGYEDDDLFLRIFRRGYTNVYIDTPLCRYRSHRQSASFSARYAESQSIFCRKLFEAYANYPMSWHGFGHTYLVRRFYPLMLKQLYPALAGDADWSIVSRIVGDLSIMLPYLPPKSRAKVHLLMELSGRPKTAIALYGMLQTLRRGLSLVRRR